MSLLANSGDSLHQMRVLTTITGYPPSIGGAQFHAHHLNQHLVNRGHQITVVCQWDQLRFDWLRGTTIDAPGPKSYTLDGIPVNLISPTLYQRESLKPLVRTYFLRQGKAINKIASTLIEHIRPHANYADIIHNVRMGREGLSFASFNLAIEKEIPFIFTPLHHPRWTSWFHRHYHKLYREANIIFALTEWEKKQMVSLGVVPDRIVTIGHGSVLSPSADPERFIEKYCLSGPIILFLGQKYKYKGFDALLDAASMVWKKIPEAQFVFIGPRTKHSKKVFGENIHECIHEIDIVDLHQKTSALLAADILCVPSTQESFGGVFLEGWETGCAVIGGEAPAVREVIADGEDGFIVPQNPRVIAEKLLILLKDPALRKQMSSNGLKKVKGRYNWETITEKVEFSYKSVLGKKT